MSDTRASAEQHLDVAQILEALRAEVRARRHTAGSSEVDPIERDLRESLDEIELHRVVSAHWPLVGRTLPERAIALVNRLVRRSLRWYINPIVEQQNAYNDAVARTLRLFAEAYLDLRGQIEAQQREQDAGRDQPASESARSPQAADVPPGAGYAALMALVRERAAAEPPAALPDLALQQVERQLRLRQQVQAHWPLPARTLPARAIALVNRLVRRSLRWYINPIVEQQNAANAAIRVALLQLMRLDAQRRAQVADLRARRARHR